MNLRELAFRVGVKLGRHRSIPFDDLAIPSSEGPSLAHEYPGDLARDFFAHDGRLVHKWVQYLEPYERHFAPYRGTSVRMLEIGVSQGGSLELWRKYLGPDAVLFGVDIDPRCKGRVDAPNQVRIGSQDDPAFLKSVVSEMGGVDLVLDDGSHIGRHQLASLNTLFPLLSDRGLYVIEDLHTAYWPRTHDGGYRRPGTGIEILKDMIDDLHAPYHDHGPKTIAGARIGSMTFYDSVAFIEKRTATRLGHIQIGG